MGMCKPSGGKIDVYGKFGRNISDRFGTPNSRTDFYDEQTRQLLQQRWYGPDGLAIWDRDWEHNNPKNNHKFPHDHPWDWNQKIPRLKPVEMNKDYC